jgi:hypothetical protein
MVSTILLLFCVLAGSSGQSGPTVWSTSSLARITPTSAAGTGRQVTLWSARNEYESFQIIVRAGSGNLTNVNITVSDLSGPDGRVIPKSAFTLYREHYVYISKPSPDLGGLNRPGPAGWYPDGLIPFAGVIKEPAPALKAVPSAVANGQNQGFWVDLLTPADAAPGQYWGSYVVSSDQGSVTGEILLTVWNFTLPLKPTLKTAFSFKNGNPGTLEATKELLRHRLSPTAETLADQRLLIDQYGLGSNNLGFWSNASYASGNCTMSPAPTVTAIQQRIAQQQPDLFLYNYTADEIGVCPSNTFDSLRQWARALHAAGARNLVTTPPRPELLDDGSGTGRSAVDIWVVANFQYTESPAGIIDVQAKGDEVWSSNALMADSYSPKWLVDFAPINFRIQPGFISQSLGISGLLYWQVDRWSSDPWNNISNTGAFSSNNYPGEGVLLYPGAQAGIPNGGAAPSIRLKLLRDGVEDFEYVHMLRTQGFGEWSRPIVQRVGPDFVNWNHDPAVLETARRELGDQLSAIHSSPVPIIPPPPEPSWSSGVVVGASDSYTDDATRNYRVVVPANASGYSGGRIRITIKASPAKAGVLGNCYIGEMTSAGVFSKAPTAVTWDGGAAGTTVAAGSSKVSDEIAFQFDKTRRYGIHFYATRRNFALQSPSVNGWGLYKSNTDSPSTAQVLAPPDVFVSVTFGLTKLEVLPELSAAIPVPAPSPAPTPSVNWNQGLELNLVDSYSDDATRNYRVVLPANASNHSGSRIRITVQASPAKAGVIGDVYVGEMSTGGVFNHPPVKITWNGGANGATVAAGARLTSDEIAFAFDKSKRYGISFYTPRRNFVLQSPAYAGWGLYKANVNGLTTGQILNPPGVYVPVTYAITKLETY